MVQLQQGGLSKFNYEGISPKHKVLENSKVKVGDQLGKMQMGWRLNWG
jgi:hypothetical protein